PASSAGRRSRSVPPGPTPRSPCRRWLRCWRGRCREGRARGTAEGGRRADAAHCRAADRGPLAEARAAGPPRLGVRGRGGRGDLLEPGAALRDRRLARRGHGRRVERTEEHTSEAQALALLVCTQL